jgi:hypothetical protein
MTVENRELAWIEAGKIFPTDYEKDDQRSERAGYPIYHSAAEGVNAWISDLGNRLEVNLPDGSAVDIWIKEPKHDRGTQITEYRDRAWWKGGLRQEELQALARKIFANGKITDVFHQSYGTNDKATTHGDEWASVQNGGVAYTVEKEGFPVKYVIHMDGYEVSEIIEMIQL